MASSRCEDLICGNAFRNALFRAATLEGVNLTETLSMRRPTVLSKSADYPSTLVSMVVKRCSKPFNPAASLGGHHNAIVAFARFALKSEVVFGLTAVFHFAQEGDIASYCIDVILAHEFDASGKMKWHLPAR